ncbi:MAG: hypothetical protein ACRD6W_01830 [Nitrososphaerales archaeon]
MSPVVVVIINGVWTLGLTVSSVLDIMRTRALNKRSKLVEETVDSVNRRWDSLKKHEQFVDEKYDKLEKNIATANSLIQGQAYQRRDN